MRNGARVLAGRHEPGDVRHVDEQVRADLAGDLAERLEVDRARVGRGPGHQHLGLELLGHVAHLVHVQALGLAVDAVVVELVVDAGEVLGVSVRQVTAVVERHREHAIAWLRQGQERAQIGLRTAVRLYVGALASEERLGALTSQVLDRVDVLATAVVTTAGVALRVLVGQRRPHRRDHLARGVVLRGDQLELLLLALDLSVDGGPYGVVRSQGRNGSGVGHR